MLTLRPTKNAKTNRGFTLVELLVVIGITAVLFTLLLGPLINSFRLTQSAQMQVAAQDAARRTSEIVSRELGSAAYVFSNTTHPFEDASPSSDPTIPDVRYSNFLVLTVPKNVNGTLSTAPAVAFNAKMDFVLPRHNSAGHLVDPTTGDPITINKNGAAAPTGFLFPAAPGTTGIRYFIGLRQPFKAGTNGTYTANPYGTQGEGALLAGNGNNTYVLYRAQFTPSNGIDPNTNMTKVNADGSTVNENLFAPTVNASGNVTSASGPELDDPDFFRIVTTNDPNWLDSRHNTYTQTQATEHNKRVAQWFQIAKPVISSPNIDLILLPHKADNTLNFDTGGTFAGTAHSGAVHDPVTGTDWPVVNTSVTFKFASVSADATASTTSDFAGQGVGANVSAVNSGLPYVPAVYTAADQSWASPYHISLQQSIPNSARYDTNIAQTTSSGMSAGDLIEAMYTSPADMMGTPVYDISTGTPLGTSTNYVPMIVAPDTATINFGLPALPGGPAKPYQRYFYVTTQQIKGNSGVIDLARLTDATGQQTPATLAGGFTVSPAVTAAGTHFVSPLPTTDGSTPTGLPFTQPPVANARIVPGSVRVYGPDATPGPNMGQAVLYSAVYPGDAVGPQDNQYELDYAHNAIRLNVADLEANPTIGSADNGTTTPLPALAIAFDYQANLAPTVDPTQPISAGNPAAPLQVKVDYQTRDLLDVNIGVRVYDPSNVGPAQIVTVHNQVRIGNSNR